MYIDPYEIFLQGQSYNWKLKKKEILVYVESTPTPPTHTHPIQKRWSAALAL